MNIVEPYAKIIPDDPYGQHEDYPESDFGIVLLKKIEWAGRVSHRSEDKITWDSYLRFISAVVLQHGDWSITEHASVTVEVLVDRGITHEWVRHRIGAYTQESTRFVNYSKEGHPPSFICPHEEDTRKEIWKESIDLADCAYAELLATGVTPQIARSVLPNALASKLIVTYNLRNWRHFFIMRTSKEAHPQMKQVTIPLLAEFKATIPLLYDDIIPDNRQADNLRLPR